MTVAGDLRRRLTFASRGSGVADVDGMVETTFVNRFTVSAEVRPKFGGEELMAARLAGRNVATITVRRNPTTLPITTDWTATDVGSGEVWNVRSPPIDPNQDGQFLEMLAEKGVPV